MYMIKKIFDSAITSLNKLVNIGLITLAVYLTMFLLFINTYWITNIADMLNVTSAEIFHFGLFILVVICMFTFVMWLVKNIIVLYQKYFG